MMTTGTMRAVGLALAAVATAAVIGMLAEGRGQEVSVEDRLRAVALPPGWERLPVPPANRARGVLVEAGRSQPPASIVVRHMRGRLGPGFDIGKLAGDAQRALVAATEGLEVLDQAIVGVAGHDAIRFAWREAVPGGAAFRSTMLIVPTSEETVYVTLRALESEYRLVREDGERVLPRLARAAMDSR